MGQAAVSFISWADHSLIPTNDKQGNHNECQSSRFNHGLLMRHPANTELARSLAYHAIRVDFSEYNNLELIQIEFQLLISNE